MPTAYVLISSSDEPQKSIIKELLKIPEVKEVQGVDGVYDIVAKVVSDDLTHLKYALTNKIRNMHSVHSINTLITTEE